MFCILGTNVLYLNLGATYGLDWESTQGAHCFIPSSRLSMLVQVQKHNRLKIQQSNVRNIKTRNAEVSKAISLRLKKKKSCNFSKKCIWCWKRWDWLQVLSCPNIWTKLQRWFSLFQCFNSSVVHNVQHYPMRIQIFIILKMHILKPWKIQWSRRHNLSTLGSASSKFWLKTPKISIYNGPT